MGRGLTVRMVVAGAALAIAVGTTFALLLFAIAQLRESAQLTRHASDELIAADAMEKVIIDLETGVRGYVITGEERFLEPWNDARAVFPTQAATLERLAADDPDDLRRVRSIVQGVTSYIQEYATPLLEAVRRDDASARSIATTGEGKQRVDALRAEVSGLREVEHARVTTRQDGADAAARRAVVAGVGVLAGSVLLVLGFTAYLTRVVVLPVRRAAGMAGRLAGWCRRCGRSPAGPRSRSSSTSPRSRGSRRRSRWRRTTSSRRRSRTRRSTRTRRWFASPPRSGTTASTSRFATMAWEASIPPAARG